MLQQSQNSPGTPVNSNSSSISDTLVSWPLPDELDSGAGQVPVPVENYLTGEVPGILNNFQMPERVISCKLISFIS